MKKDPSKKPEPRIFLGRVRSKKGKKPVRKTESIHRAWGLASRLEHIKTKEKKK